MFRPGQWLLPVLSAPMGGGVATPALIAAVADCGGSGMVPGGEATVDAAREVLRETQWRTGRPIGLHLHLTPRSRATPAGLGRPAAPVSDPGILSAYRTALLPDAGALRTHLPLPSRDHDAELADKVQLAIDERLPYVSFTFGVPAAGIVDALHDAGVAVLVKVTAAAEAAAAAAGGADLLIAQGPEAGGPSAIFDPAEFPDTRVRLADLVRDVAAVTGLPVIAAGGLTTGAGVRAVVEAGASAIMLGTALLRTPEAGTTSGYRRALTAPSLRISEFTRVFLGRPGRVLANELVRAQEKRVPLADPWVGELTLPLRTAAAEQASLHKMAVWAGAGWRQITDEPAAAVVGRLWESAGLGALAGARR